MTGLSKKIALACICNHYIQATELLHCGLDQVLHLGFVRDITVGVERGDALLSQAVHCLLSCRVINITDHYCSTFPAQAVGNSIPDSFGRTWRARRTATSSSDCFVLLMLHGQGNLNLWLANCCSTLTTAITDIGSCSSSRAGCFAPGCFAPVTTAILLASLRAAIPVEREVGIDQRVLRH